MEQEIKPTPSKDEEKLSNNHNINQLKHQTVPSLPGSLYFPNFFSDQLADSLFEYCKNLNASQRGTISGRKGPKVHFFSNKNLLEDNYPTILKPMLDLLCSYKIIPGIPFQISINHYENPSQGMVKHRDGPATQVVIITLGSSAILDFYKLRPANSQTQYQTEVYTEEDVEDDKPVVGLFLRPKSVVRLTQSSYEEFAHGITAREWDEVTNSIGNLETCEARLGEVFPRSTRISIVMWNKQNFCN